MHTATSIYIRAPREEIFAVVSNLTRWPEYLPHYRHVNVIGEGLRGPLLKMCALRSGIPISWTAEYWSDPRALELHFNHLQHWTKGMKVVWTLTPTRDGTRVAIVHNLAFRVPGLGWLVEPIIGKLFIEHIARRTLATFKEQLELAKTPEFKEVN